MACIVYREGTGTVEHGIECESTTCEVYDLHSMLSDGWSQTPPGYVPPDPVPVEEQDLDSTITPRSTGDSAEGADLQPEVDRLAGEVKALAEEVDQLNKILELQSEIEKNQAQTIEHLKSVLAEHGIQYAAEETEEEETEDDLSNLNPVRLAAKEAGIEGWDTKRIGTLQKALEA